MQQSRFMAIMNDYDRTLQLIRTSTNSAGEANAQYEIYTKSVEAANKKMQNSFEAFYVKLTSSEAIKTVYDSISGLVDKFTALGPVMSALTITSAAMIAKYLVATTAIQAETIAIEMQNAVKAKSIFLDSKTLSLGPRIFATIAKMIFFRNAETAATMTATAAMHAYNAAVALTLGAFAVLAVVLIASISAWKKHKQAIYDNYKASLAIADTSSREASTLQNLINRYEELTSKISLQDSEKEELLAVTKELADINPDLVIGIDEEGNARLRNIDAMKKELAGKLALAKQDAEKAYADRNVLVKEAGWTDEENLTEEGKKYLEQARAGSESIRQQLMSYGIQKGFDPLSIQGQFDQAVSEVEDGQITMEEALEKMAKAVSNNKLSYEEILKEIRKIPSIQDDLLQDLNSISTEMGFDIQSGFNFLEGLGEGDKQKIATGGLTKEDIVFYRNKFVQQMLGDDSVEYKGIYANFGETLEKNASDAMGKYDIFGAKKVSDEAAARLSLVNKLINTKMSEALFIDSDAFTTETQSQMSSIGAYVIQEFENLKDEVDDSGKRIYSDKEIVEKMGDDGAKNATLYYDALVEAERKGGKKYIKDRNKVLEEIKTGSFNDIQAAQIEMVKAAGLIEGTPQADFLKNSLFDPTVYTDQLKEFLGGFYDQYNSIFNELPVSLNEFFIKTYDNASDQLKSYYIPMVKKVFAENAEFANEFNTMLNSTNMSDPVQIQALQQKLVDKLVEEQYSLDTAWEVAKEMISREMKGVQAFVDAAKKAYDELKKLDEEIKKAIAGFTSGAALEQTKTFGFNGLQRIDNDLYTLTGNAVEEERQKRVSAFVIELQQEMEEINDALLNNKNELEDIAIKGDNVTAVEVERAKVLVTSSDELIQQNKFMERMLDDALKLTDAEKARKNYLETTSAINSISALASSLKDLGGLYTQINEGTMTQLDIITAIAENPDYLQFLTVQNDQLKLSSALLIQEAKHRIENVKTLINERIAKITAAQSSLKAIINSKVGEEEANKNLARQTIQDLQETTDANELAQTGKLDALKVYEKAIQQTDEAEDNAYQNSIKRIQSQIEAFRKRTLAMQGEDVGDATTVKTKGVDLKTQNLEIKEVVTQSTDWWQEYLDDRGVTSKTLVDQAKDLWNILENDKKGLAATLSTLKMPVESFLSEVSGKSKDGSDKVEELNDSLEKFYNTLRKIERLQSEISLIEAQMGLNSTDAKEDLKLIKEKAKKMNELIGYQKGLINLRQNELRTMQNQVPLYNGFLFLENGILKVRQAALSVALLSGRISQEQYDKTVDFLEKYQEVYNGIQESLKTIVDLEEERESMRKEMVDRAINVRQQLYDAFREMDEQEIQATEDKFDKLKEMEDDYLSAIKDAIDKEREMREQSQDEQDLLKKQRQLSTLQRDTSGRYAERVADLQTEIAEDQQDLRDKQIDRQYETLQKQYELQQEQRDIELQLLQEQMRLREDSGYYWSMVDQTIKEGPDKINAVLTGTEGFQKLDPLAKSEQLRTIQDDAKYISKLYQEGVSLSKNSTTSVANAIGYAIAAAIKAGTSDEDYSPIDDEDDGSDTGGGSEIPDKAYPGQIFTTGSAGDWVKYIQQKILSWNADALPRYGADGKFGSETYSAVRAFQTANGLQVDGKVGPLTWEKLNQYKEGGVVDYTGAAAVHGTLQDPEAFLNAKQTELIAKLRDTLENNGVNTINKTPIVNNNNSITIGDVIVNLENETNASPDEIAKLVRKEILNAYQNRMTTPVQRVR